ncbi:MAG TPA: DUF2079 domain-containing protein, partial [Polyangia bacterium]
EFANPYLAGTMTVALSAAVAFAVAKHLAAVKDRRWRAWDLSRRHAWMLTFAAWGTFILVIGFLSHWRQITFHAEPYDTSWETNAVWGITRHGIPTISIGADAFYKTQRLPAPYFDAHVPLSYYLYAPFYALWSDTRLLVWLQAVWMGAGSLGAYLIGRRWLRREWAGVVFAWVYVLNPEIQGLCLHDIHANILAIPTVVLAAGLMEAGRARWATVAAIVAAMCREETAVYSACLGLFWLFGGRDRVRVRCGLIVLVASAIVLALITQVLMPAFGGRPRWEHFHLFFRGVGISSVIGSFALNPWGALVSATETNKIEFFWISLVPVGFLALRGLRAGWFALVSLALLVAAGNPSFFTPGMNYSAPIGLTVVMMAFMGARAQLLGLRNRTLTLLSVNRVALMAYLATATLVGNWLWGNVLAKGFQFEYGQAPYRRASQYNYRGRMGSVATLPPYGQRERDLWEVIRRVPAGAPIATSWSINPQLSSRDVAVILPYMAETNPPESAPKYVVIDKLPPIMETPEKWWLRFRRDPKWRVYYENRQGVIFERK